MNENDIYNAIVKKGGKYKKLESVSWMAKIFNSLFLQVPLIGAVVESITRKANAKHIDTLFYRTAEIMNQIYIDLNQKITEGQLDKLFESPIQLENLRVLTEKIIQKTLNEPVEMKRNYLNQLLTSMYNMALENPNYDFDEVEEIIILFFDKVATGTIRYLHWIIENYEEYHHLFTNAVERGDEAAEEELYIMYGKDRIGDTPKASQIFNHLITQEITKEFEHGRYHHEELIINGILPRDRNTYYGGTSAFQETLQIIRKGELPYLIRRIVEYVKEK